MKRNHLAGRLGDLSHPSLDPAATGSSNTLVNNRPALRVGDCGASGWVAIEGAPHVLINGRYAHRILDKHSQSNLCTSCKDTQFGDGPNTSKISQGDDLRIVELVEVTELGNVVVSAIGQTRRQYINLDRKVGIDSQANDLSIGRVIRMKAKVERVGGAGAPSVKGEKVRWSIVSAKTNATAPTLVERAGFVHTGGPTTYYIEVGEDGWTPVVEVYLSTYGGDSFRIETRLESDDFDRITSREYLVYRKLFFEVLETVEVVEGIEKSYTLPIDVENKITKTYESVFVELQKINGNKTISLNEAPLNDGDLNHLTQWVRAHATLDAVPFMIWFILLGSSKMKPDPKDLAIGIAGIEPSDTPFALIYKAATDKASGSFRIALANLGIHEVGHALGLVPNDATWRASGYEFHCNDSQCYLRHSLYYVDLRFCAHCSSYLRKLDLGRTGLAKLWPTVNLGSWKKSSHFG